MAVTAKWHSTIFGAIINGRNILVFSLQGSDGGSVVFASTPAQVATTAPSPTVPRKSDFPQTGLPLSNGPLGLGGSASPIPIPTSQGTAAPAPSPAPAALPPPSLPPPYTTPMQVSVHSFVLSRYIVHPSCVGRRDERHRKSAIETIVSSK